MELSSFAIFKNKNKSKDSHPDWNVTAKNEFGEYRTIGACWTKTTKSGDKYLSCAINQPQDTQKKETNENEDGLDGF